MLWVILVILIAVGWIITTYASGQQQRSSARGTSRTAWSSASEKQLRRRVGPSTAERLITHALERYPDKSRAWCADKALHDLRRDYRG